MTFKGSEVTAQFKKKKKKYVATTVVVNQDLLDQNAMSNLHMKQKDKTNIYSCNFNCYNPIFTAKQNILR